MWRIFLIILVLVFASKLNAQSFQNDSTQNGYYLFKVNDSVKIKAYFKSDKRHKIWTWYNTDGSTFKQVKYKNGKLIWLIYFEKNKVWLKINRKGKRRIIRACDCREG